jgi:hypothetical protein
MEKEFIPYEQALALKELGFDEPCFGWFRSTLIPSNFTEFFLETEFGMNESPSDWMNSNFLDKACSAPLYQQAFRWFRKEHNLFGYSYPNDYQMYGYRIVELKNPENKELIYDWGTLNTSEEAELKCLKRLIEIVKKQK